MIYYLLSIALLTTIFWLLSKVKILSVCPICVATVLTWVGGLFGIYLGAFWANPLIVAILMGASVGALADKYGSGFGVFWKTVMVILGLSAIYFLVQKSLYQGLGLAGLLVAFTAFSYNGQPTILRARKDLFKDCC